MYAIKYNRLEMVQELIRAGAALDVQAKNGYTALVYARKYPEIATLLDEAEAARTDEMAQVQFP